MSWYVSQDGQHIWIGKEEMVYTVVSSEGTLPLETLAYLAVSSKKAVYTEAIVEEAVADGRGTMSKKKKEKTSGKQRGFILRADVEESPVTKVVPWFKVATQKLLDCGLISRLDPDEAANSKKKNKNRGEKAATSLGANECHVETTSRIHHFAHGPGFRVEVSEGNVTQRLHFYTSRKEINPKEWHSLLVTAIESTGSHVMLARKTALEMAEGELAKEEAAGEGRNGMKVQLKKDKASQDESAWLQSMLNGCLVAEADAEGEEEEDRGSRGSQKETPQPARPREAEQEEEESPKERSSPSRSSPSAAASQPRQGGASQRQPQRQAPPSVSQVHSRWAALSEPAPERGQRQQPRQQPVSQPTWDQCRPQQQLQQQLWDRSRRPQQQSWYTQAWEDSSPQQSWEPSSQRQWQEGYRQQGGADGRELLNLLQGAPDHLQAPAPPQEREPQRRGRVCGECRRGGPLKLFQDPEDECWYCRVCWVEFYGKEPPMKS